MTIKWIAEIGSNHNQDLIRTLKLIDKAKEIGCWAVKFQLFTGKALYHPSFKSHIEKMDKWALPPDFLIHIANRCIKNKLKFICTPFSLEAVKMLEHAVDLFKIGSYELLWIDLIEAVIKTGKPWIISAGMESFELNKELSSEEDGFLYNIRKAERLGRKYNNPPYAILHCNSNYPAKPKNCNLKRIDTLKNYFYDIPIGWSDHTVHPCVIYEAINQGAKIIEFHFDMRINRQYGIESEIGHCWYPDEIQNVIEDVKTMEVARQINNDTGESEAKKWRTDPEDGLRPLKKYRGELLK